ncbi:MAG: protein kinase [Gemmataceae bacterium]|nr:protein kinase [Gemmataceae bacterium]
MSVPTDKGQPPAADEHAEPTVVDVGRGAAAPGDSSAEHEFSLDESAGGASASETPALGPLSRIGDYELVREIGRGGMGVVFQARHVRLGRTVALKMILGGSLAAAEDLQRFDTEVAAAAQLQHPNIVALYEVSAHAQQPYFSMEFISGANLAKRLGSGPMSNRRAAAYLEAVARAVHHAHERGIIHRDLKPANILLDDHDQPKVTDFGLAKVLSTDSGQTRTGAVLGTPSYMAPEQAAGQRTIGPSCDIWSLGAILYEMLTGRPPFRGETAMATLQQVANQDPIPPRMFDPALNPDLETICLKCLEKEPGRRYATAEALADDLRRYLDEEAIAARRHGVVDQALKWSRRKPGQAAAVAIGLASVVAFTVFMIVTHAEERRLRNQAEQAQRLAQVREEAMRHLLYLAEMRRAQQALEDADFDRVQQLLRRHDRRPGQRDLRDWEWHFLMARSQAPNTMVAHPYQAKAVAWRPDGAQFASAGGEPGKPGEIKIWDAATGKVVATLTGHALAVTSLAWRPHTDQLASAGFDRTVRLWDTSQAKELVRLRGHRFEVQCVAFSPAGDVLVSGSRDKTIRWWRVDEVLAGKTDARTITGHDGDVTAVAFAADGGTLASASADKTVRLWDTKNLQQRLVLTGHDGPVQCLAFHPRGAFLASGGGQGFRRGEVRLWNPDNGQALASRFGLSERISALSCNAAGLLAAGSMDGLVHVWDQAKSSEGLTFRADKQVLGLAFHPDGGRIAVAGGSGRISMFNSSASLESKLVPAGALVEAIAFDPAGKFVIAGGRGGSLRQWRLDQASPPVDFAGHAATIMSIAVSPDGRLLAAGDEDGTILLHDLQAPATPPRQLGGHDRPVRALAFGAVFGAHGSFLASAGDDDTVRLWDPRAGKSTQTLTHGNSVRALAVSRDGRWLASAGVDKFVHLWDMTTGTSTKLAGHTATVNALAFSPDGQRLISGGSDRTIRLWNVSDKASEPGLEGLSAPVLALAFHPDGRRFASLGQDKIIRLWDVITRQEILELEDSSGWPRTLAFSCDGRWLAAGSGAALRLWDSGRSSNE